MQELTAIQMIDLFIEQKKSSIKLYNKNYTGNKVIDELIEKMQEALASDVIALDIIRANVDAELNRYKLKVN